MSTREARQRMAEAEARRKAERSEVWTARRLEILQALTPAQRAAYAGVYQAYAWDQGFRGTGATSYRTPDAQHFYRGDPLNAEPETEPDVMGFVWQEFMAVVADMDSDGYIHYWKLETIVHPTFHELFDRVATLACTEDNSMDHMLPTEERKFHHATDPYWLDIDG